MNASYLQVQIGGDDINESLLSDVYIFQQLNNHWQAKIRFRTTADKKPAPLAGKPVRITSFDSDGSQHVLFSGIALDSVHEFETWGSYSTEVDAYSLSRKMDFSPQYSYFLKETSDATAQKVVGRTGLQLKGSVEGPSLSRVQWQETDWQFLLRLVDDGEAWVRPTEDGLETQTSFQAGSTLEWRQGEYGLLNFNIRERARPINQSGSHYHFAQSQSNNYQGIKSQSSYYGTVGEMVSNALSASESLPDDNQIERHRATDIGSYEQRLQLESRRAAANAVVCEGISRNPQVKAGEEVTISGLGEGLDGTYGVIECSHHWTARGFENHFKAVPAKRWFQAERAPLPVAQGTYEARVMDHNDPKKMGRIKIQYFWQDDGVTHWARMISPHAGSGRGFMWMPEKGDEVVVAFQDGDPERPVILGCVWNSQDAAPREEFWGGELEDNNVKRILTKSGNRLQFVDKPDKESIVLATPNRLRIALIENTNEHGRSTILLHSEDGDICLSAPNGQVHIHSKYFTKETN